MLGALLAVGGKVPGEVVVGSGRRAARPRPGDGMGQEPVALDAEEEFRAGADNLEVRHADEEQVRAGADAAERAVKVDAQLI